MRGRRGGEKGWEGGGRGGGRRGWGRLVDCSILGVGSHKFDISQIVLLSIAAVLGISLTLILSSYLDPHEVFVAL